MKFLIAGILSLAADSVSAQSLTKAQLTSLLQSKKAQLEFVNAGMSKATVTTASVTLEMGVKCEYNLTAIQSVLKIEGDKMVVLSQEAFRPVLTQACREAGFEAFDETVVFYEAKPSLAQDLEDLNASDVRSITRAGELVTLSVNGTITNEDGSTSSELLLVKYDLTKPSFKNMVLSQSPSFKIETLDRPDIDVNAVDLRDVVFCENNDGDNSDCVRGDFSDILF